MARGMAAAVGVLASNLTSGALRAARDRLVRHARTKILPHADSEARTLYAAACALRDMARLVDALRLAGGLEAPFVAHVSGDSDVPAATLSEHAEVDLDAVLGRMRPDVCVACHGDPDAAEYDEELVVDVRSVRPAERLILVRRLVVVGPAPGKTIAVVADHDPAVLRAQLEAAHAERLAWRYRAAGLNTWELVIALAGADADGEDGGPTGGDPTGGTDA